MTQKEIERLKKRHGSEQREQKMKKFALSLLEQCESEEMTIFEFYEMLDFMKAYCEKNVVIRCSRDA